MIEQADPTASVSPAQDMTHSQALPLSARKTGAQTARLAAPTVTLVRGESRTESAICAWIGDP
jgi:hypothetical protein